MWRPLVTLPKAAMLYWWGCESLLGIRLGENGSRKLEVTLSRYFAINGSSDMNTDY